MAKKKVLVVDDEPGIREFLAQVLSARYQILFAKDGNEAVNMARNESPDAMVLDMIMPGKNGIEVCRELRDDPKMKLMPILMVTAINEPEQRTDAFITGVDDYIAKPFNPDELLARVESKLKRLAEIKPERPGIVQFGDVTLNFLELKTEIAGKEIEIGQIEFKILNCLILNQGKLVPRDTLHDYVWGNESPSDRALDPHITTLRRKLRASQGEIKTVYGRGYSLVLKEQSA